MDQDHVSVLHRNGHVEVGVQRVDPRNRGTIYEHGYVQLLRSLHKILKLIFL